MIKNCLWSIKELFKFKKTYVLYMLIEAITKAILPVVSLIIIQNVVDMLQFKSKNIESIVFMIILFSVFQLSCEIVINTVRLKMDNSELEFEEYFQKRLLQKISLLDCKRFENSKTYDLINRTQYDANASIIGNVNSLFSFFTLLIGSISYAFIIIRYNIFLFLVVVLLPIVRFYFEKKYSLFEYETHKKNTENNRMIAYIYFLLTNSENFKEMRMFGLFDFFINKFKEIKNECNSRFFSLNKKRACTYNILNIFENVIDLLVTIYLLYGTFYEKISIGKFILLNNSNDNLKVNVVSMLSQLSFLYKNSAVIEQIRTFFDLVEEDTRDDGIRIDEIKSIVLKNVFYRYRQDEEYVLKNISLDFNSGDMIVFMGYNGSGKSTLMKILMGVYNDYEGEIFINGFEMRNINLNQYRKKISVMFQDYIKFESSVEDNIRYGNIDSNIYENRIFDLFNKLNMDEFKVMLSQKLGYQFSDGIQISIGQWQKLALARTLYKESDIYIFDEPNSSLDIATENFVWQVIKSEMKNKISFIIMHRFNSMIECANKIIVLNEGEIMNIGSHKELLGCCELYNELYSIHKSV